MLSQTCGSQIMITFRPNTHKSRILMSRRCEKSDAVMYLFYKAFNMNLYSYENGDALVTHVRIAVSLFQQFTHVSVS